jgi:hypothetical protein
MFILIFSSYSHLFCIDNELSNVFKATTQVMDNDGSKRSQKDLPSEETVLPKSLVESPLPHRGTVRKGDACMHKHELSMLPKFEL